MRQNAGIQKILAMMLAVAVAISMPLTGFSQQPTGPDWQLSLGDSGTARGNIYIDGTDFSSADCWTIDESGLPDSVALSATAVVKPGVFPVSLELRYSFAYTGSNTAPVITTQDAQGNTVELPMENHAGSTRIFFSGWDDTYTFTVTDEDRGRHAAVYTIGIAEDADAGAGEHRLSGMTLTVGDRELMVTSKGSVIRPFSLFPFPLESELQVVLPDDMSISELLEATVSFSFVNPNGADVATLDGRKLKEGDRLFADYSELSTFAQAGMEFLVGAVEQLNTDRLKYSLELVGGIDDVGGLGILRVTPENGGSYTSGSFSSSAKTLTFRIWNFQPEENYVWEYTNRISAATGSSLVGFYEGSAATGTNLAQALLDGTYVSRLVDGEEYTFTFRDQNENRTETYTLKVSDYDYTSEGFYIYTNFSDYGKNSYLTSGRTEYVPISESPGSEAYVSYVLLEDSSLDLSDLTAWYRAYTYDEQGYTVDVTDQATVTWAGREVKNGVSTLDYTGDPVYLYAVYGEQTDFTTAYVLNKVNPNGGELLVTAQDEVEVTFSNSSYGRKTDFHLYNIGTGELKGLKATLRDGTVFALDDYWTVGNETVFTPNSLQGIKAGENFYNAQWNHAKVTVRVKAGTTQGDYEDQLILSVGGEVVRTITINGEVTRDITGEEPGGENPGGENPGGENPGGENPGGENPGGENPGGEKPGGENPGGEFPGGIGTPGGSGTAPGYNQPSAGGSRKASGGSGGGWSGGGRSGSSPDRFSSTLSVTNGYSNNVSADGTVNVTVLRTELEEAIRTASSGTVFLRTRNARLIEAAALKMLSTTAAAAGKNVVLYADTLNGDGTAVQGRLYLEPEKLSVAILPGVYTDDAHTASVRAKFTQASGNPVAVVTLDQKTAYGARLQVAAKVSLAGMNTESLYLYSYNRSTNEYSALPDPGYFIDSAGYLHFYTEAGGDIIITDTPL